MGLLRVKQGAKSTLTDEQIKYLTPTIQWKWNTDWDKLLKNIYERDFSGLPKSSLPPFFKIQFDPEMFSVLSFATVGRVTVRYYAIFERIQEDEGKEKKTRLMIRILISCKVLLPFLRIF